MTFDGGEKPSLEFLVEPALILQREGEIGGANSAARRLLGSDLVSRNLFDWIVGAPEELRGLLRRASGSTAPLLGAVSLKGVGGVVRIRVHGARASPRQSGQAWLILRCLAARDDQFALLDRKVRHLDAQLRKRLQENAALERALTQNRDLLRELQHRVKNNIQLMMSLIHLSAKDREGPQVAELVETARLRLQAMACAQEAIYRSDEMGTVSARGLLSEVIGGVGANYAATDALKVDLEDARLSAENAHCLALIANELVVNACKHGRRAGRGAIRVSFRALSPGYEFVVHDNGPGLPPRAGARSSGLDLVRGLCRQIGGKFEIVNEGGTKCLLQFS